MRRMQSRASVEEETEGKEGAREKKGDMYTSVCAPEDLCWGPAEQGQEERLSNVLFRAKADVTGGVEECLINPGGTITMSTCALAGDACASRAQTSECSTLS